jgi:glutamate-1-semialdehyde aminotransferase/spore coat polysaccharide biosynthesis protein SpsF (cytidylyltransferase family)
MSKTIAVCQARMSSTRLPGKVLKQISARLDWTVLDAVVQAAGARGVDEVWVATSDQKADDIIAVHCNTRGYKCFRGSETDVISRYIGVANESSADIIVRLTCDCPFLDSTVISQVIQLRKMTGADYASNIDPATWPDGLDCEVFTSTALRLADIHTHRAIDRDCVTTYIRNNKRQFKTVNLTCPLPRLDKERWVLDSPEDLAFCQELGKRIQRWPVSHLEVLAILEKEPELRKLNDRLTRNERYYASLGSEPVGFRSTHTSQLLFDKASRHIPLAAQTFSKSHIQYPSKAPLFVTHGDGGYIYDVDGNDYVDMVSGLLPVILGYRDPDVDLAIRRQLDCGISFSLSTELEAELASRLVKHIPCAEMARFGKSGTDVTTAAVRLARAYTKRRNILIPGGYHGWNDWSVAYTERGLGTIEIPTMRRCQPLATSIEDELRADDFAAVIVEPEGPPAYLEYLREITTRYGALLIFDEVITGFRFALGGAQEFYGVTPDLACFGKAMGNGMPISAVVGRLDIMRLCEPPDNIFYSGTMFGETLSLAAAIATIDKLESTNALDTIHKNGHYIRTIIHDLIIRNNLEQYIELEGHVSLNRIKFRRNDIKTLFIQEMIRKGVLIIASHNLSYAHGMPEIDRVIGAWTHALGVIRQAVDAKNTAAFIEGQSIQKFAAVR